MRSLDEIYNQSQTEFKDVKKVIKTDQEAASTGTPKKRSLDDIYNTAYDIQTVPEEPGALRRFGGGILDVFKGFGKEAAARVHSVTNNIAKVVDAATTRIEGGASADARVRLAQTNDALLRKIQTLPVGDMNRMKLEDQVKENLRIMEQTGKMQDERMADQAKFNERPKMFTPEGGAEEFGAGVEKVGEFLAGAGAIRKGLQFGAKTIIPGEQQIAASLAKTGLSPTSQKALLALGGSGLEALNAGTITTAQGGDAKDIRNSMVLAGVLSTPFKALSAFRDTASKAVMTTAEKKASQALGATTKINKELSDKVVPELLRRRVTFFTRNGLSSKADKMIDDVGAKLEDAYDSLPPDTKVAIAPILEKIEQAKGYYMVEGSKVIPTSAKPYYAALQKMQEDLLEVASSDLSKITEKSGVFSPEGATVSLNSLRNFRQILDSITKKSGKSFGFTMSDTAKVEANKSMANAIRSELAEQFPDIAKINKEFNFWSNVKTVIDSTIQRTKSQATPLAEEINTDAAAVAGAVIQGKVGAALFYGAVAKMLTKTVKSPGWRMTSAVTRARIADAIASGNFQAATDIMNRIIVGMASSPDTSPTESTPQE